MSIAVAQKVTLDKTEIDRNEKVKHQVEGENNKYTFDNGGVLRVNYNGVSSEYSELSSVEFTQNGAKVKKEPEIIFGNDGKIKEAYFTVGKEGDYVIGDKKLNIPKGAGVIFKDNRAYIVLPKEGNKIKVPTTIDGGKQTTISYRSAEGVNFDGYTIKGDVNFNDGKFFLDGDAEIDSIEIKNPEKVKTYLDFNGEPNLAYDSAYISINKQKGSIIVGSNIDKRSPVVRLKKDNPFGIKLEDKDNFAFQSLGNSEGAYFWIQDRTKENKVPLVKTLNQWRINQDGKGIYYNYGNNGLFLRPNDVVINDFGEKIEGSSSTPLEIQSYRKEGGGEIKSISKYGNILGIGNINNLGYGNDPNFIRTHIPDSYKKRSGVGAPGLYTGFSNSLTYNYDLTLKGLERFARVNINDHVGALEKPQNVKMMMDIFASLPAKHLRNLGTFSIVGGNPGWAGLAGGRHARVAYNNGGFSPHIIRHELTHIRWFALGSSFNRDWRKAGGSNGPHTWRYGYRGGYAETISTFGEMMYADSWGSHRGSGGGTFTSWKSGLQDKTVRARVVLFNKYGYITRFEANRIFKLAGLPYDDNSFKKYLGEVGIS